MEIIKDNTTYHSNLSLILGFFDGVHLGHRKVIESAILHAKKNNTKSLLITFKNSPQKFFSDKFNYIYPREYSYKLIENLGVDYILEKDFSKIVNQTADEYLNYLIKTFNPISISTGFNHSFGFKKEGNAEFLESKKEQYGYKYFCIPAVKMKDEKISSTLIKKELELGNIKKANNFLGANFVLQSTVIEGKKLGRTLGFPTANLIYPQNIVKIPHGVYSVRVFDMPAILNWGVKPTFNNKQELLEVHIPNFNTNLYGKSLQIEFIDKIRDEIKFNSIDELKSQIQEDIKCLKL